MIRGLKQHHPFSSSVLEEKKNVTWFIRANMVASPKYLYSLMTLMPSFHASQSMVLNQIKQLHPTIEQHTIIKI